MHVNRTWEAAVRSKYRYEGIYVSMNFDNAIIMNAGMYLMILGLPVAVLDLIYLCIVKEGYKRYIIFLLMIEVFIIHRLLCPTYWKYPDALIVGDTTFSEDVEELYGPFDEESNEGSCYKAYYIYTDKNEKKHYYVMWIIPDEGYVWAVSDEIIDNGVLVTE